MNVIFTFNLGHVHCKRFSLTLELILLQYFIYRVLGNCVSELEEKLKTLEISGLWSHGKFITYFQNQCRKAEIMFPQKAYF